MTLAVLDLSVVEAGGVIEKPCKSHASQDAVVEGKIVGGELTRSNV